MNKEILRRLDIHNTLDVIQALGYCEGRDKWFSMTVEAKHQELQDFNNSLRDIRDYLYGLERREDLRDPDYDIYLGSWFCPSCHEKVRLLQKFCDKCGQRLGNYER